MEAITTAEMLELLPIVMNFRSLRGLSVAQALEVAQAEREGRQRLYVIHALDNRDEKAYSIARDRLRRVEIVIEVLEAAIAHEAAQRAEKRETKARCAHFKSIKRAFSIAREAGLDTRADDAFRAACSRFLGREIESREELTGRDWLLVGDAIKARRLAW